MNSPYLLYIDLFCGAGGTSTGVERATLDGEKCAKVIACVNHDANAIASHAANHPHALHFTEDIRTLDLLPLVNFTRQIQAIYPQAKLVLWASLECTNFSKAKGGLPRDADSRTLAEHLFRYIDALKPDYLQIENVEEFMSWGPLDDNGKPISRKAGEDYLRWIGEVQFYGYRYDFHILNAADYGAYTSRRRYFGQFAKLGLPICWPEPTHAKRGSKNLFVSLKPWRAVKEVLDFADEGLSIFAERKKPLSERTLERIHAGLVKFVAGGKAAFLAKYNSSDRQGNVSPNSCTSIDQPAHTIAVQARMNLVQVAFIQQRNSGKPEHKVIALDQPARTLTQTGGNMELVQPQFLSAYYGNGHNHSVEEPSPVLTTKDRLAKVQPCFLDMQYGNGTPADINEPAPTCTTNPKHKLVVCHKWLYNPQYANKGRSTETPCFTLIARMDKKPPYLVTTESGEVAIEVYAADSLWTAKIKEFMALYAIVDIKMRMLRLHELLQIMGFPKDYKLVGTQADQKKFIGNAVETNQACALCVATAKGLLSCS